MSAVQSQLPHRWRWLKLKYLSSEPLKYGANEAAVGDDRSHPRYIRITDLTEGGQLRDDTFKSLPPEVAADYLLSDGDLLLARSGATVGKAFMYRSEWGPACFAGYLIRFRPNRNAILPQYLWHASRSGVFSEQVNSSVIQTTIQNVSAERYANFLLPIPRIEEQASIAAFLDRETASIDELVAKRARLIGLLNEKRRALITHAVTKGLDSKVRMKDSEEKWLGEVPAQWNVVPSNRLFVERKEKAHEGDEHLSATQAYGVIPLTEFERLEGRQVTHAEKNLEQRKHVEVDNFVISMRSFEGGIERVKARGCVRSSYIALVAGENVHIGFFSYLFKSSAYIQGLQATAMFIRDGQDLSYHNFRQVKLPLPSIDEQRRIAEFLDREVSKSNALIAKTQEANRNLLEYRSALISAAVTGQIDVHNCHREEAAAVCP